MEKLKAIVSNLQEEAVQLDSDATMFFVRGSKLEAERLWVQWHLLNQAIDLMVVGMAKYNEHGPISKVL